MEFEASLPSLGHGLLTGQIRTVDDFADDDWRKTNPRFTGEKFQRYLRIVDEVRAIGAEIGATPAQAALAWLLTRGDDIAPIPGTAESRVSWRTPPPAVWNSAPNSSTASHRPKANATTRRTWLASTAVRPGSGGGALLAWTGSAPPPVHTPPRSGADGPSNRVQGVMA